MTWKRWTELPGTRCNGLKQREGQVCNLPNYFVCLNSSSSHYSELQSGTRGLIPSGAGARSLEFGFSSCPTSGSIFQPHVGCYWEPDTNEKGHILNLWPFLLLPFPLALPISSSVSPSFLRGYLPILPFLQPKVLHPPSTFFPFVLLRLQISTISNKGRKP